jgi:hypothetical protein
LHTTALEVGLVTIIPRSTVIPLFPGTEFPNGSPVTEVIDQVCDRLRALLLEAAMRGVSDPLMMLELEQELHSTIPGVCIDPFVGAMIQEAHVDPVVIARAEEVLDSIPKMRLQKDDQGVGIRLRGGTTVRIETPYFLQRGKKRGGQKGTGRGRAAGRGVYPVLAVLGIHGRVTPALASEVARLVALGTLDEAGVSLARQGVKLNRKTIHRITRDVAARALALRQTQLEAKWVRGVRDRPSLKGMRLGICVDGGRIRIRVKKQGRKRRNGGKSFKAEWKEPKVLVIYELDESGRKRRGGFTFYDATMGDADVLFELLEAHLRALKAVEAKLWAVGGDGAKWIWNRVGELAKALAYDRRKVIEFIDFWHAAGYLSEFAGHIKYWSDAESKKWVKKMKRWLREGRVDEVISEMRLYCRGRKGGDLNTIADRFETNLHRMRYKMFRLRKLPCGSGVVESGVRRIVNLRFKGNGIFWKLETAESLLHLRAQYLSGGWDRYMSLILDHQAFWTGEAARDAEKLAA